MASKISKARLMRDHSIMIDAKDYDKNKHGIAVCPDLRCLCRLRGVSATQRNVGDEQVSVAAYFGLPANAEKSGAGHAPRCRFNVEATVKRLVARSKEIKNVDGNAEPILIGSRRGIAEYRLHILMELLAGNAFFVDGGSENDKKGSRRRVGTEYIKSDKVLAPYFRMAIAVLTLIARVRETPDLAQWIRLKYAEHTIAWPDYYYGLGEHGRLYEFLHRNGQLIGSRKRNRPASVVVDIDKTREVHLTRHRSWAVPCRTSKCATQEFGDIALHPWLYVNDEGLARKIHTWTLVLVCAIPTTAILSPAPAPRLRPFAKINLPIVNRAQVCRYSLSER